MSKNSGDRDQPEEEILPRGGQMKAIVVTDKAAGAAGMKLVERPEPQGAALASLSGANYGDVIAQVHASGFTGERRMNKRARAVSG